MHAVIISCTTRLLLLGLAVAGVALAEALLVLLGWIMLPLCSMSCLLAWTACTVQRQPSYDEWMALQQGARWLRPPWSVLWLVGPEMGSALFFAAKGRVIVAAVWLLVVLSLLGMRAALLHLVKEVA